MREWSPRRGSAFSPGFSEGLAAAIGQDHLWLWDNAAPELERVLCGLDRDLLDAAYPPDRFGLRLMLTARTRGLPPLRIVFRIDDNDHEKIVYVAVSAR